MSGAIDVPGVKFIADNVHARVHNQNPIRVAPVTPPSM